MISAPQPPRLAEPLLPAAAGRSAETMHGTSFRCWGGRLPHLRGCVARVRSSRRRQHVEPRPQGSRPYDRLGGWAGGVRPDRRCAGGIRPACGLAGVKRLREGTAARGSTADDQIRLVREVI